MITTENLVSHEFIGLKTKIIDSSNNQLIGLNGIIVDETKSMFTIDTGNGFKKITKANNKWKFSIQEQNVILDGSSLCKRSFDRIKVNT